MKHVQADPLVDNGYDENSQDPKAAASVGVAQPRYILPMMATIMKKGGRKAGRVRTFP